MGQSPLAAAQIAAQVAEVREVNDGLCALFLPQQADAHGLAGGGGSSAARTDAIGKLYLPSGAPPSARMRLRRRTIGGVGV